mgnify:CR=1 FL=1
MKIKLRLSKVGIKIIKGTCLLLGVFFIGLGFYKGGFFMLPAFLSLFFLFIMFIMWFDF